MKNLASVLAVGLITLSFSGLGMAQSNLIAAPQNVVQLQASGTVEVQQDLLVLTLGTVKEGKDAATVQTQLKQALDAALAQTRELAEAQKMDVRTGAFSLSPRYGEKQQITGWQGRAEIVLEGRDFPRITGTAAKVSTMTISRIAFDLSREQRAAVEQDAQKSAIAQFKRRAEQLSKEFGFTGYSLREVSVDSSSSAPGPVPRMEAMKSSFSSSDSPVPVEAGKAEVTVTVSGSVQMK